MRMRKKKNLDVRFERCASVMVSDPRAVRGKWRELFGNDNPIRLEIGCGKGRFILETARRNPDINFVAIEKEEGALIMATEKAIAEELPNLHFLSFDAAALNEIFAPNRQRKRRLTWRAFLAVYDEILEEEGAIFFKTDNQRLFEWSLGELCQNGWLLQNISLDLHKSDYDNIMTEYEEKFSAQGYRIYRVEARKRIEKNLLK